MVIRAGPLSELAPTPGWTFRAETWLALHEVIMRTVNIHEAKTHLSKLVDAAAKGESFIIAKAGKPLVKVVPLDAPAAPRRIGFLVGIDDWKMPDDFDRMCQYEIAALFEGEP
jgi:prevent-host-death family protein